MCDHWFLDQTNNKYSRFSTCLTTWSSLWKGDVYHNTIFYKNGWSFFPDSRSLRSVAVQRSQPNSSSNMRSPPLRFCSKEWFLAFRFVNNLYMLKNDRAHLSAINGKRKRKVGGKRYEARSRGHSCPDTLAFWACEMPDRADYCLDYQWLSSKTGTFQLELWFTHKLHHKLSTNIDCTYQQRTRTTVFSNTIYREFPPCGRRSPMRFRLLATAKAINA